MVNFAYGVGVDMARRQQRPLRPDGQPMTLAEYDAWLDAQPKRVPYPEYRAFFAIYRDSIAYKLMSPELDQLITDQDLHDTFRGGLDVLFRRMFFYGRVLDHQTMAMIVHLLEEDIKLSPEFVLNPVSVFNAMRSVQYVEPKRRHWTEYRRLEDGMPIHN